MFEHPWLVVHDRRFLAEVVACVVPCFHPCLRPCRLRCCTGAYIRECSARTSATDLPIGTLSSTPSFDRTWIHTTGSCRSACRRSTFDGTARSADRRRRCPCCNRRSTGRRTLLPCPWNCTGLFRHWRRLAVTTGSVRPAFRCSRCGDSCSTGFSHSDICIASC